ncbi:MAG: TGS domain-containing protein [Chloroflexi bacterium]|nr:TGS domain-containing protein [Chloroflexota bacterium]
MPANLPPQYFEAEKNFRSAKTATEKIAWLEEMLAIMPHHKGTDHLRAELRRRIAKLSEETDRRGATQRTSMTIPREGAAQVAVIGPPNTGKSQLVALVTNATPMVADYPFTTHTATPGMMEFENVKIQLVDTPALAPQTMAFWMPALLRKADAFLIMIDLSADPVAQMEYVIAELEKMRIGIIDREMTQGQFPLLHRKKALVVGNKIDLPGAQENFASLQSQYADHLPLVAISALKGTGIEEMKLKLYQTFDVIRVYTRVPGGKPDFTDPIVLPRGGTLEEAAAAVHKDFVAKLKYARVWGSGKHDGIMVKRDYELQDGDVIELHV